MISFDDVKKLDIRIGTIKTAEKVEGADRLLIVSGIAEHYSDAEELVGKQVPVVMNLEPRTIRGVESQGMILYAVGEDFLTTVEPGKEVPAGTPVQ